MFARDTHVDLLAITASAPTLQLRGRGQLLLARERAARLDDGGMLYNRPPDPHFAFADLANANALRGGVDAAERYFHFRDVLAGWSGIARLDTPPPSTYPGVMAEVVPAAAQLRAETVASMSGDAWTTARLPWLNRWVRADFATNTGVDVLRASVEGNVAPGGALSLTLHGPKPIGYALASDTQISVAPGSH